MHCFGTANFLMALAKLAADEDASSTNLKIDNNLWWSYLQANIKGEETLVISLLVIIRKGEGMVFQFYYYF